MRINKVKAATSYQQRLDDFAQEYDVKFGWYHWACPDGSTKHRIRAIGSGISVMGDWQGTHAQAVDDIFKKIEED